MRKDLIKNLLIAILTISTLLTVYGLYVKTVDLRNAENIISKQKTNTKVVVFTQMLIDKVLKSKTPVDFDTRLALENMVRDLGDQAILYEWNRFVNSTDSDQTQMAMKNLLDLLVRKINIIN